MRSRTVLLAALCYATITLVLTYPFSTHLSTHVLAPGTDTDLAIWTLGWDLHALTHRPWAIFDANIFFPFHNTLAYSENLIGSALVAAPVVWLTGNTILAMNLVVLFSVAAGALGAFLLARRLGLSTPAAYVAGLIFGFAPPRFLRMGQLPYTTVEWIPFALLALHLYFETGRARHLRIFVALFSLQALTSGHGVAMLTLAVAMLLIWKWLHGEPLAFRRRLRDIGWPGALALLPSALIYVPYKLAQVEVGLKRQLDDWSLSLPSYFTSPTIVDRWLLARMPDWSWLKGEPDAWLFPGILPLLMAGLAIWLHVASAAPPAPGRGWRRAALALEWLGVGFLGLAVWVTVSGGVRVHAGTTVLFTSHGATPWVQFAVVVALRLLLLRRAPLSPSLRLHRVAEWFAVWRRSLNTRDHLWFYLSLFLMCVWLSVGPPFGVWRWLYWLPGLNFVRVPSRFTIVGMLALSLVAAAGFDRLMAGRRAAARAIAGAVCAALLIGEFAIWPVRSVAHPMEIPAIDRWVGTQSEPMALLEMPLSRSPLDPRREQWTTRFMLHSMAHWKPIFVGFSGIQPPGYPENYWTLTGFPDAASLAVARRLGITHVILHADLIDPDIRDAVEAKYAAFADDVVLVHEEGEGRVYEIRQGHRAEGTGQR
jgi:hypothetical protein